MNTKAIKKHELYNALDKLDDDDLSSLADYAQFLLSKKQKEILLQLKGILSPYKIKLSLIKDLRSTTWKHLEDELRNG